MRVTICPPSRRNKPKTVIKSSGGTPNHVWLGSLIARTERIEKELNEAVDSRLLPMEKRK